MVRKDSVRGIVVVVLATLSLAAPTNAQQKKTAKANNGTTASPTTPQPAPSNASLAQAGQPSTSPLAEYPADYIPCVFTLQELLGLRLRPVSATLTASDDENLKTRLISEATAQADTSALTPTMKLQFLTLIGQASFEGLTPSQALAAVIAMLQDVDAVERRVKQFEDAAKLSTVEALVDLAKQQLPLQSLDAEDGPLIEKNLVAGLTNDMVAGDRLRQLATNVSGLMTGAKYFHPQFDDPIKRLTQDLQNASVELQVSANISDQSAQDKETQEESIAKQAIVDTARTTVQAFQRPLDVGCAMSVLSWNETKFAFGRVIANEYIAVQVVVRNLNEKQEFSLHDAELSVDTDINGRFGRFYSGRDKLIVRGLSLAQADYTPRNFTVHLAEAAGTIMSAALPVAGTVFRDAVGVYNGGFLPGLKTTWTDHSVDQLNLLSDIGFSSSTNYKTVVPKSGSVMFVMFIPSKQFEEGWWTQKCAEHIPFVKKSPQYIWPTSSTSIYLERNPENVGIDLAAARQVCKEFGTVVQPPALVTPQPPATPAGASPTSQPAESQSSIPDAGDVTTVLAVTKVPYKNWSPIGLGIFQELAWAVVAGAHVQEVQNQSAVTQLSCPTDEVGNIQFNKTGTVSCDLTGEALDKVATLRLRDAQDATDTDTADGTVTVSGDATKAKATFQLSKLGSLNKSVYKVYTVTTTGVEAFANQTVHFDLNPFVTDLSPATADPNKQSSIPITLKGFHLDKIAKVQLFEGGYKPGATALLQYDMDAGATATQAAFTMKATDDDLKKKSSEGSGEALTVELLVKNSSGAPVNGGSINLSSTVSLNPDIVAFDPQSVKTTSGAKTVTLTNSGTVALNGFDVKISGADPASFSQTNACGAEVIAGAKCVLTLKFSPVSAGKLAGSLSVTYTLGGSQQSQSVSLTGTGKASGKLANTTLSAKNLTFAPQKSGTLSGGKTVTLENSGATALTGFEAKITGANASSFSETTTCGSIVAAGARCVFTLKFAPTAAGKNAANLNIAYEAGGSKQSQSVSLLGTGSQ